MNQRQPHVTRKVCRRNSTGVVGVHLRRVARMRRGVRVVRSFYRVNIGGFTRNFSIDMLGQKLALQEALRCRATWEKEVAALAQALSSGRKEKTKAQKRQWMRTHCTPAQRRVYYEKNRATLLAGQKRRRAAARGKGGAR